MRRCILFYIIILVGVELYFFSDAEGADNNSDKKIIATVGIHNISLAEFSSRYTDYLIGAGVNDNNVVRESILNNMINEVILYSYDDNRSIFTNSGYQHELKWTKKEAVLAYLKDQEIYKNITATDQEIREAFIRVNEMVAARHLYAKTRKEADELYALLKTGIGFDVLAKQVFSDSVLKNNGGYLGYFTWGDMDPAFEDVAYSLKIGEISKPVKTAYGYSIIKVEDKVRKPILTENEYLSKKNHLAQVIRMRKMKPSERAYLKSIINSDKIKFNDKSVGNILSDLNFSKPSELKNTSEPSVVCASYEGKKYSQFDIENQLSELPLFQRNRIKDASNLEAVIKGLILQDTLYSIAVSKGYDTSKTVTDTYKKMLTDLFMRYKTVEIMKKAQVPDSVVYQYYKENIKNFMSPKEISVEELIVDNRKTADSLKSLAENGADFEQLVGKFSLKRNISEQENSVYTELDQYGDLKDTLWNSSTGNITGPFGIGNYYVLFKIMGKKDGSPLDFNLIKNRVAILVKKQMSRSLMEDYANNLKKSVDIKINYDLLWKYKISGISNKSKLN